MKTEKYLRAAIAGLIAAGGAVIAAGGAPPETTWDVVMLIIGAATAGLSAFAAFLSRYSGNLPE